MWIIPLYIPEFRELLVVLVRAGVVDVGEGVRCREPKRPCLFSGWTGAGSSNTSSSGLRWVKNGILIYVMMLLLRLGSDKGDICYASFFATVKFDDN